MTGCAEWHHRCCIPGDYRPCCSAEEGIQHHKPDISCAILVRRVLSFSGLWEYFCIVYFKVTQQRRLGRNVHAWLQGAWSAGTGGGQASRS